jgi:nucleotide-binding universal stress UspA family protein
MPTYLIVANQSLASAKLADAVLERVAAGDATFRVVVPATPAPHGFTWDEDEAKRGAQERLDALLERLRALGVDASGEIGASDPVAAAQDAIRRNPVDEIILSTLAPGISRWLGLDVPNRLRSSVPVPVTVVVAPQGAE